MCLRDGLREILTTRNDEWRRASRASLVNKMRDEFFPVPRSPEIMTLPSKWTASAMSRSSLPNVTRLIKLQREDWRALVDGRQAASGSKCFQVLEGGELVRGVPEIATFAFGESGASCDGVLNVPAVAAVDERHLIVRHGRHDQKVMAIFDFRHDNVIEFQLTLSRQAPPPSVPFIYASLTFSPWDPWDHVPRQRSPPAPREAGRTRFAGKPTGGRNTPPVACCDEPKPFVADEPFDCAVC